MRLIKIPFCDISYYDKTRLAQKPGAKPSAPIPAASQTLYFRNAAGFSANDYIVIEPFESEDAELMQISAVDSEAHAIDLTTPSIQEHPVGVVVIQAPYNKVKVYKGSSTSFVTHTTEVTPVGGANLRPDNAYTTVIDSAGTTADYYSYKYFNTQTALYGTQTLFTESDYDSILTVKQLKEHFMFGLDLTDDDGYPFPNSMFEFAIRAGVDSLEKTIGIKIKPVQILEEFQDFHAQDYRDFAFLQLDYWPVISVERVRIQYPTAETPVEFPVEWVQLRKQHGQIHLVPTSGSLSTILMGRGGDYLTFVWRGYDFMPNLWRIDYTAGFAAGSCPSDIVGVVGKLACYYPLNIAGDLVGGIAIASKSIGVDGLSQSINTTSSPENAGYCVMKSTIYTESGEVKIENLVDKNPALLTFYKGRAVRNVASKVWMTKVEAPVWRIIFDDGSDIIATKEHPVMLSNGKYLGIENLKESIQVMGIKGLRTVRRIVPNYKSGPVFDIEVPRTHNFIANGVVVHNSARLRQYERELKIELPKLKQFYAGIRFISA